MLFTNCIHMTAYNIARLHLDMIRECTCDLGHFELCRSHTCSGLRGDPIGEQELRDTLLNGGSFGMLQAILEGLNSAFGKSITRRVVGCTGDVLSDRNDLNSALVNDVLLSVTTLCGSPKFAKMF